MACAALAAGAPPLGGRLAARLVQLLQGTAQAGAGALLAHSGAAAGRPDDPAPGPWTLKCWVEGAEALTSQALLPHVVRMLRHGAAALELIQPLVGLLQELQDLPLPPPPPPQLQQQPSPDGAPNGVPERLQRPPSAGGAPDLAPPQLGLAVAVFRMLQAALFANDAACRKLSSSMQQAVAQRQHRPEEGQGRPQHLLVHPPQQLTAPALALCRTRAAEAWEALDGVVPAVSVLATAGEPAAWWHEAALQLNVLPIFSTYVNNTGKAGRLKRDARLPLFSCREDCSATGRGWGVRRAWLQPIDITPPPILLD